MFRILSLTVAALALAAGQNRAADDDPAAKQVELKKGDRIIFFGDSLTALAGIDGPKDKGVTTGYVRIVRDALREKHKDKGYGGPRCLDQNRANREVGSPLSSRPVSYLSRA